MTDDDTVKRKRSDENALNVSKISSKRQNVRDDYLRVVEDMMYPSRPYSSYGFSPDEFKYPIHQITALGLLESTIREPHIMEKWSPYEIALFECSIYIFGKVFHKIQKKIKTKSTKEVIEFYYEWKKSRHYQIWKKNYIPDERDTPTVVVDD